MSRNNQERKKLSVVLRDYDLNTRHCNGINDMALIAPVRGSSLSGTCSLFTASRDRLIKVWNVDYGKMMSSQGRDNVEGMSLLADLDGHTDWVN